LARARGPKLQTIIVLKIERAGLYRESSRPVKLSHTARPVKERRILKMIVIYNITC
jgi:hypothetical protein